jgi:hypothetical protein
MRQKGHVMVNNCVEKKNTLPFLVEFSSVKSSSSLVSTMPAPILPRWANIAHVYHKIPN